MAQYLNRWPRNMRGGDGSGSLYLHYHIDCHADDLHSGLDNWADHSRRYIGEHRPGVCRNLPDHSPVFGKYFGVALNCIDSHRNRNSAIDSIVYVLR